MKWMQLIITFTLPCRKIEYQMTVVRRLRSKADYQPPRQQSGNLVAKVLQEPANCDEACHQEAKKQHRRSHAAVDARAAAAHAMRRLAVKALQPPAKASEHSHIQPRSPGRRQRQASVLQPRPRKEWQPVRQLKPCSVSTTASQQHSPAAGSAPVPAGASKHVEEGTGPPVGSSPWERLTNGVSDHIFAHLSVPALRNFRLVETALH